MTDSNDQGFSVNTGLLLLITGLLVYAIIIQGGVLNPTIQSTQSEVRAIACAIAEQTANASRVRTEDPKTGELETRRHFLTRMLAQRHTLLIAKGTGCRSAPGFPPFDVQVARALREINALLGYRNAGPSNEEAAGRSRSLQSRVDGGAAGAGGSHTFTGGGVNVPTGGDQDGSVQGGVGGGSTDRDSKPQAPGTTQPQAPDEGGNAPASAPVQAGTSGNQNRPDPPPPASSTAESVLDVVPPTVEAVGDGVQGAVEGVGKAGDCALRGGCAQK